MSLAVLPFAASIEELQGMSGEIPELLTAFLSGEPGLALVERAQLAGALGEMELGMSGTVDPGSAAKIGYLVGAQILVTGRVFPVQRDTVVVAKVISVDTGRVFAETVTIPPRGSVVEAAQELTAGISALVSENRTVLAPDIEPQESVVARLRPLVQDHKLPSFSIDIPEMSINREVIDPAAETEIALILQNLGFEVIDPLASNTRADVEITGEAFSEFGLRMGNLVSSRGRVEIKAIDRRAGTVLLVDREVSVAVDIAPEIAGKAALAKSASRLAERLVLAMLEGAPIAQ